MWPLKLLLLLVLIYVAILVAVWALQARILFPAGMVPPAGPLPPGASRLQIDAGDGDQLHGVHFPAAGSGTGTPILLGFGGNAWNAEAMAVHLHELYPQAEVFAFHYRGYAPSTGSPAAAALLADAPFLFDSIAGGEPRRPIVAVGFSVGAGVAASLAPRRPVAGLILVTPFDSLRKVAADHFRWLPVRWLFRHDMDSARDLRGSRVPVALIAAGEDRLIARGRTESLRRAVPNLVLDRTIAGAGHNDLYERQDYRAAMAEALARIMRAL